MKNDDIPCCAADALRRIRQVPINGIMTGITTLDESIAAVMDQGLNGDREIREALMKNVRVYNYVPAGVDEAYATAIMGEFRKAVAKKEQRRN
jgi:hypothetical protein